MIHHVHTRGAAFLALSVVGASLKALPLAAQPTVPVKPEVIPSDAQRKLDIEIFRIEQEQLAKTKISLDVKDATLPEVLDQIKAQIPKLQTIELRKEHPVRVTFAVENMEASRVIQAVMTLAGCDYVQLNDRALISPPEHITPRERWESRRTSVISASGIKSSGRSSMDVALGVAPEVRQFPGQSAPLSKLSVESQRTLLRAVAQLRESNSATRQLTPTDRVSVINDDPKQTTVIIEPMSSEKKHQYRFTYQGPGKINKP